MLKSMMPEHHHHHTTTTTTDHHHHHHQHQHLEDFNNIHIIYGVIIMFPFIKQMEILNSGVIIYIDQRKQLLLLQVDRGRW